MIQPEFREIYRVNSFPIFQNQMFETKEEAEKCLTGDIVLVQDQKSGLIFNESFNPELMSYGIDYQNEQAGSGIFQKHLQEVLQKIKNHFHGCSLIEVGCGKGYFLELLQDSGFQIMGFDPTYEGSNPAIMKKYFTPHSEHQADGIVLRHVLEHIQNPVDFCFKIRDSNGGKGKIYIEVPCFDWILKNRAWFDIFYEHVNYFRVQDFFRMFDDIYEIGHLFGGQYLYVIADLQTLKVPVCDPSDLVKLPGNFWDTVEYFKNKIKSNTAKPIAAWGGASKGVIFSLFMKRLGFHLNMIIDINPAKQWKYIASTGLQVIPPQEAVKKLDEGSEIIVMNSNYLQEVKDMTDNRFSYSTLDNILF